ncbi:molybdenum cofactor biosynthesis protein MoaE [Sphingobium aquiterrae]|uniref:molybdenum cofactor biosynthesis protein MoaE n=1 Tax=Sphingobium aquiterrae TaxID=2038656 RepID=UPI0030173165
MIEARVQTGDFDVAAELAALERLGGGAVASFTGLVRGEGGLRSLTLEHYPAMTQAQMARIGEQAAQRWPLLGIRIVHRIGTLAPGARIVFVGTASSHRMAALESCAFLIDWLKTDAPFWKKEAHGDGSERWVDARQEDAARAAGWVAED